MLKEEDIEISLKCQQFECQTYMRSSDEKQSVLIFESKRNTEDVSCPYCGGKVHICDLTSKCLRDMPIWSGVAQEVNFVCHRYRCTQCGRKHTEQIPVQYPGTRITDRAAEWIKTLLLNKITIKGVQAITHIHWETIRNLHREIMETTLQEHWEGLKAQGYKPKFLAVDEFAIHKGHTYATCVMDLATGDVLWVGNGRSKADFLLFFDEIEHSFLTDVVAVAMDMNASYYQVVQEKLPQAQIVYDRYHMQAQFGKDVLGAVRLQEAYSHKACAQELQRQLADIPTCDKPAAKAVIRAERQEYSKIKKLRWTLLADGEELTECQSKELSDILSEHANLAVCYAMKEEMIRLFDIRNLPEAEIGWRRWFEAAKESGVPALAHFAELKEKRIDGLIAHALYPVSTGRLEGFNNKIKVAKRIGYGYRDDHYFFTLVRFLSLSPNFP